MHSILVRGATLSTALPLALDALKLVWPREVDAYRASVKGSNYHHTAKRCLMENAWRIMDHGAFVEALRMDFTEALRRQGELAAAPVHLSPPGGIHAGRRSRLGGGTGGRQGQG